MFVQGKYEGIRSPSFDSIARAKTGDIVIAAEQCAGRWTNALIELAGGKDNQISQTCLSDSGVTYSTDLQPIGAGSGGSSGCRGSWPTVILISARKRTITLNIV